MDIVYGILNHMILKSSTSDANELLKYLSRTHLAGEMSCLVLSFFFLLLFFLLVIDARKCRIIRV